MRDESSGGVLRTLFRIGHLATSKTETRSGERNRRILLTSGSAVAAKLVSSGVALVTVPLTVSYLGTERYGLWMTITSVFTFLGFADFGMGNGLLNAVAASDGTGDVDSARRQISSAFYMLSAIAAAVGVLLLLVFPFVSWSKLFNVHSVLATTEARTTAAVLVCLFCVNLPLGTVQRVQQGYQEGFATNAWTVLGSVFSLAGLLLGITAKAGLPWLALALVGGPTLAVAINWLYFFGRSRPWLLPRFQHFEWASAVGLARTGSLFFVLSLLALIASASDNLVIAHVLGPSAVSTYAITQKLFLTLALAQYFVTPLWPAFGEALANNDVPWARRTLRRALWLSVWAGLLTGLPLLLLGQTAVRLWVGQAVVPSIALLAGFGLWLLMSGYGGVMSMFLNTGPLLRRQLPLYACAATVAVALKVAGAYAWGLEGVIFGTVLGWGLVYVIPSAKLAFGYLDSLMPDAAGVVARVPHDTGTARPCVDAAGLRQVMES